MTLPGKLSKSGPRQDNDSNIIGDIKILPTKDELLCRRAAYLPYNNPTSPHFLDGPARLFDIQFRLLREDMIQPIQTRLAAIYSRLMHNIPISNAVNINPRLDSTFSYFDVIIESACCDKMKGLMFRLRFRQRTKFPSSKKRIKYWEDI